MTKDTKLSQDIVYFESLGYDIHTKKLVIILGCNSDDPVSLVINDSDTKPPTVIGIDLPYRYSARYDITIKDDTSIKFLSKGKLLQLEFPGQMSKLSSRKSYWNIGNLTATRSNTTIEFKTRSSLIQIKKEVVFILDILIKHRNIRAFVMRCLYWLTRPYFKSKNIWLFADKIYRGGDNAEYAYLYTLDQEDKDIKPYYILSSSSVDADRFRKSNIPFVTYKSIFQRLLFLNANILVFTHNNAPGFYRFGGKNSIHFRDLYNYDTMYIQHGLSIQKMSKLYNKSVDDIKRYFIASSFEEKNLLKSDYGYQKHEIVHSGQARYDGLNSRPKKNVLIAPTWRHNLANNNRDYDESGTAIDHFKNTSYFKIYNKILLDPKLLSHLKKHNYTLTLLLHPSISDAINLFPVDHDLISVVSPSQTISYDSLLSESNVLVTDYSGLQFDFAYMYKPILYYHNNELTPQYEESIYSYSSSALGKLLTTHNKLIDELCLQMESNILDSKYKNRIDSFFYHHDNKNSQRIYNYIKQWSKDQNKNNIL